MCVVSATHCNRHFCTWHNLMTPVFTKVKIRVVLLTWFKYLFYGFDKAFLIYVLVLKDRKDLLLTTQEFFSWTPPKILFGILYRLIRLMYNFVCLVFFVFILGFLFCFFFVFFFPKSSQIIHFCMILYLIWQIIKKNVFECRNRLVIFVKRVLTKNSVSINFGDISLCLLSCFDVISFGVVCPFIHLLLQLCKLIKKTKSCDRIFANSYL